MAQNPIPLDRDDEFHNLRIITRKELLTIVPYTIQNIGRLEAKGKFPKRVRLGPGRVGWLLHEVQAWIQELKSERDTGERLIWKPKSQSPNSEKTDQLVIKPVNQPIQEENEPAQPDNTFITVQEMMKLLGCTGTQLDSLEYTQRIPVRITLPDGRVGWYKGVLERLNENRSR